MKDKNGIEITCSNCADEASKTCFLLNPLKGSVGPICKKYFHPSKEAYEQRIQSLEDENIKILKREELREKLSKISKGLKASCLNCVRKSCLAQGELEFIDEVCDSYEGPSVSPNKVIEDLKLENRELRSSLNKTIKLLSERSKECGELEGKILLLERTLTEKVIDERLKGAQLKWSKEDNRLQSRLGIFEFSIFNVKKSTWTLAIKVKGHIVDVYSVRSLEKGKEIAQEWVKKSLIT